MAHTARSGVIALIIACTIWGLAPIYYKALAHVPPLEVLTHRTLWSILIFCVYLALQGRLAKVWRLIRSRDLPVVALGAVMISINWFVFIRSIQVGQASLGCYIFPIVAVVLGEAA